MDSQKGETIKEYKRELLNASKESLLAVLGFLKDIPDGQFIMEYWWSDDGFMFDEDGRKFKIAEGKCGCVIGHLIDKGLLSKEVTKIKSKDPLFPDLSIRPENVLYMQIARALKLDFNTTQFLFNPQHYLDKHRPIKKVDVIKRIRFIVEELESD